MGTIGWSTTATYCLYHVFTACLLVTTSLLRTTSTQENTATHGHSPIGPRKGSGNVANEDSAWDNELVNGGWYVVKKFRKILNHATFHTDPLHDCSWRLIRERPISGRQALCHKASQIAYYPCSQGKDLLPLFQLVSPTSGTPY